MTAVVQQAAGLGSSNVTKPVRNAVIAGLQERLGAAGTEELLRAACAHASRADTSQRE